VLDRLLTVVQGILCPPLPPGLELAKKSDHNLPLNMADICYYQRRAGFPVKLRQTIEGLFQMYHTVLADPDTFDLVLDLYDAFGTLHRLITDLLPRALERAFQPWEKTMRMLSKSKVGQIEALVSAMENALYHRIAKFFPVRNPLDMAIDFRGGLNQIILASAAPMICSLGLFRRCLVEPEMKKAAQRDAKGTWDHHNSRCTVGIVSGISLVSGMEARILQLGYERIGEPQLAFYEVDVPHILHITSHIDYFHETGHLVFRNTFTPDAPEEYRTDLPRGVDTFWQERLLGSEEARAHSAATIRTLDEVFAMFFTQVFVFGTDVTAPLIHQAISYARSLASIGEEDEEGRVECDSIVRITDLAVRLTLVRLLLPEKDREDAALPETVAAWFERVPPIPETEEATGVFLEVLKLVGPCCCEYERLWRSESMDFKAEEYACRAFRQTYEDVREFLPWVFRTVGRLYRVYREKVDLPDGTEGLTSQQVRNEIEESLRTGRPVMRCRLPICGGNGADQESLPFEPRESFVDPLFLVSGALHEYIRTCLGSTGKRMVLERRKEEQGAIRYPSQGSGEKQEWWEYQVDRGSASLFCPVPKARRQRTLKQIVIRQMFRDIAASLQSRRLYRIVYDTLRHDRA